MEIGGHIPSLIGSCGLCRSNFEDFRGLHKLQQAIGRRFSAGVVLYDGETSAGFGDGLYAVPIRTLWET